LPACGPGAPFLAMWFMGAACCRDGGPPMLVFLVLVLVKS
jgi:hypothetical protein